MLSLIWVYSLTMVINVKVIPKAKKNVVKKVKNNFKVYVTSPFKKGRANVAVINLLSEYFKVKKYHINIIEGQHSKDKVIEIPD